MNHNLLVYYSLKVIGSVVYKHTQLPTMIFKWSCGVSLCYLLLSPYVYLFLKYIYIYIYIYHNHIINAFLIVIIKHLLRIYYSLTSKPISCNIHFSKKEICVYNSLVCREKLIVVVYVYMYSYKNRSNVYF